jgi:hypothetical protein
MRRGFLGVPRGGKSSGIGTKQVAAGLRARAPKPERTRVSEPNEWVESRHRILAEIRRSILASQKRPHTIRVPSYDLNDAVIEQIILCARLMDDSRLMEAMRTGSLTLSYESYLHYRFRFCVVIG